MTGVPQNVVELSDILNFAQSGTVSRMQKGLCYLCIITDTSCSVYHWQVTLNSQSSKIWAEIRSVAMVALLVYDIGIQYAR